MACCRLVKWLFDNLLRSPRATKISCDLDGTPTNITHSLMCFSCQSLNACRCSYPKEEAQATQLVETKNSATRLNTAIELEPRFYWGRRSLIAKRLGQKDTRYYICLGYGCICSIMTARRSIGVDPWEMTHPRVYTFCLGSEFSLSMPQELVRSREPSVIDERMCVCQRRVAGEGCYLYCCLDTCITS